MLKERWDIRLYVPQTDATLNDGRADSSTRNGIVKMNGGGLEELLEDGWEPFGVRPETEMYYWAVFLRKLEIIEVPDFMGEVDKHPSE